MKRTVDYVELNECRGMRAVERAADEALEEIAAEEELLARGKRDATRPPWLQDGERSYPLGRVNRARR